MAVTSEIKKVVTSVEQFVMTHVDVHTEMQIRKQNDEIQRQLEAHRAAKAAQEPTTAPKEQVEETKQAKDDDFFGGAKKLWQGLGKKI